MSRPSSAGAKRSSSGGKSSSNIPTEYYGGYGNIATNGSASGSGKRPSSAGHSRPVSYSGAQYGHILGQSISSRIAAVNTAMSQGQTPQMYGQYPGVPSQQGQNVSAQYAATYTGSGTGSGTGYARPKSAGSTSGSYHASSTNAATTIQQQQQQQQQQQYYLQQQQQQKQQQRAAALQQYGYGTTSSGGSTSQNVTMPQPHPTSKPQQTVPTSSAADQQQWNNAYKLHYGYSSGTGKEQQQQQQPMAPNKSTSSAGPTHKIPNIAPTVTLPVPNTNIQKTQPSTTSSTTNMPVIATPSAVPRPSSASAVPSNHAANLSSSASAPVIVVPTVGQTVANADAAAVIGLRASDAAAIGVRATRPSSASATTRIRLAIDESHKYTSATGAPIEAADPDDDFDEADDGMGMGLLDAKHGDGPNQGAQGTAGGGDDEEMDGKQINGSATRSHPEISTASPSVEFGQLSLTTGGSAIDRNNGSMDSLQEEHINVGLTTVPNQFCSAREALELKKLLILSKGARGGIVPSSTAVMDMYMVGKVVGVGSYGKVRAAWHRLTGAKVAIKTYDKAKLKDPAHWKRVHSEIKIMEQVSHPRIARMYEAVETPKRMHLIMECLDGGNLCSYVKSKRRLSEEESTKIFFQILQSIDHLHLLGVTHRDVKLENVLFIDPKDCKEIKLIDFGFSTVCQPGKKLKVFCGTPSYMAPEIVQRLEYEGKAVDMWSMGILMYALLCGCFPFRAKSYPDLYRRIARGTFQIPDELSMSARDLLRQLLNVDPVQRMTASAAMRHPWLAKQLASAADMNKIRLETTILISDRPADDVDDQVLAELETFGFPKDEIVRLVMTKTHSSIATMYYLLMDHIISKRRLAGGPKRPQSAMNSTAHHGTSFGHANAANTKQIYQGGAITPASAQFGATTTIRPSSAYAGAPSHAHRNEQQQTLAGQHANYQQYVLQQPQQQQQQQQQQQAMANDSAARQEYVGGSSTGNRPRSASGRPIITGPQRPLSAYVMRR